MADAKYNLVFEGKVIKGQDPAKVKKNLMTLLKSDEKAIERLFSGRPSIIKKNMDQQTAAKYQEAMNRAGAQCKIETVQEMQPSAPEPAEDMPIKPKQPPAKSKEVPPPAKPEMILCPSCNYRQKKSDKCIMCGIAIARMVPAPEDAGTGAAPPIRKPLIEGDLILTNIEYVPGREIVEHFGLVSGNTIRAKHIGKDIMAGLKNLVGGELKGYTELLTESRDQAVDRMKTQAKQLGANAVINIRFSTSNVAQGAAELYAYGTAVRVE
jgi:uncharacterized protein YbjQ (UPF0145 family)